MTTPLEQVREMRNNSRLVYSRGCQDCSGSEFADKALDALEAVLAMHSPKILFHMRDGNHIYSCAGCDTNVTFTEFKNCKTRAAIVEVMNR